MNCFYRQSVPAIGLGKNCNRGLCRECFATVEDSLACRGACEDKVTALHLLMAQALRTNRITKSAYGRNAVVYLITGLAMLAMAISSIQQDSKSFLGFLFLFLAATTLMGAFNSFRGWRAFAESPTDNPNRLSGGTPNSILPPANPNHPFESPTDSRQK